MSEQLSFWDDMPFQTALSIPSSLKATFDSPYKIAREYFPNASDGELEGIISGETGWPSFWRIGVDGNSAEECFRNQLLRALARRQIKYSNVEIVEDDPYTGTVGKIELKQDRLENCVVKLNDGTEIYVDACGIGTIKFGDDAKVLLLGNVNLVDKADSISMELPGGNFLTVLADGSHKVENLPYIDHSWNDGPFWEAHSVRHLSIKKDRECDVKLPDGSIIRVDEYGNFQIDDSNAKVIYKANTVREFNRFINASDLLEAFIEYAGTIGATQSNFLNLPIEMFINWLIVEAAKADGEPVEMVQRTNLLTNAKVVDLGALVQSMGITVIEDEDWQEAFLEYMG